MKAERAKQSQLATAEEYRLPMRVTEMKVFYDNMAYFVCPRCKITMERDFCAYCDRCGQRLNWCAYKRARRIFAED